MARFIAVACGVAVCCVALAVRADEEHPRVEAGLSLSASGDEDVHGDEDAHAHAHGEAHEHAAHAHEGHAHEHRPLSLGLDLVLGFGAFPMTLPTRGDEPGEGFSYLGEVAVNSQSLLIAGGYEVAHHIGVGARIPLTLGSVPGADESTHSTFALGNVELEGEAEVELNEAATLVFSLGVALPTAMGSEEPEFEEGELSSAYDQFVLNRIAAASRGFEDNALFEVDRLGIIPKLQLKVRANEILVLEPFVKLENLIATNSELERGYIAEFVFGTFVGVQLGEHFDLGVRAWGSAAFLEEVESVGVVEPQVRAHFVPVDAVLGGIIPFAGELTEPQFGGVRLGAVVHI